MKICQITPYFSPDLGGVETVVEKYAKYLNSYGHDITILTSENSKRTNTSFQIVEYNSLINIRGAYFPVSSNYLSKLGSIEADIYHFHANKRFVTDLGAIWSQIRKKKFVFSPHAGQFGETLLGKLHNATIGRVPFKAGCVICVSEYEKKLITTARIESKNIIVLPNGVEVSDFKNLKKDFFVKHGWERNLVLMSVGRLTFHKRIDILIKALKLLLPAIPETRLAIIGPDWGEKQNLLNIARAEGVENYLSFFGSLSREELLNAYSSSDIFVLPSKSEAFGLVLVEAMAAKRPVVGNNQCSIPEIIKDKETGLLFSGTSTDLAAKIVWLIKNETEKQRFVKNAYQKVVSEYDWKLIVKRLEQIYLDLL